MPSKNFFEASDIEVGDLDPDSIKAYQDKMTKNMAAEKKKKGQLVGEKLESTKKHPLHKIPHYSGVKY